MPKTTPALTLEMMELFGTPPLRAPQGRHMGVLREGFYNLQ